MVGIINISAFLLLSGAIALRCEKKTVAAMPLVYSGLMLLLYILAFFRRMQWIDAIAAVAIIGVLVWTIVQTNWRPLLKQLAQPSLLVFLLVAVAGVWLLSDRALSTFDEFNFWGIDAKAMWGLGGLAKKGLNCSPAYGDYPPIPSISGWWLLHMAGRYDEGLTISGQYLAIVMFLSPLFVKLPHSKWVWLLCFPWVCTFSAFGTVIYQHRSPDVLMGICYGCALLMILEYSKKRDIFGLLGIGLTLAVLVLIKSVGIEWAVFALLFMLLLLAKSGWKQTLLVAVLPMASYLSWITFCVLMNRSTYLVNSYLSSLDAVTPPRMCYNRGSPWQRSFSRRRSNLSAARKFLGVYPFPSWQFC